MGSKYLNETFKGIFSMLPEAPSFLSSQEERNTILVICSQTTLILTILGDKYGSGPLVKGVEAMYYS